MNWDGLQREVLDALGYARYTRPDVRPEPLPGSQPGDALLQALLRATGRAADAADAQALCAQWRPLVEELRMPARKRALWPRLRALRASGPDPGP